eukprot:TRINITY_DN59026_c0_g1_i1.p1 TRINITY_DN59026_c0_g1~~TRINITY_DN59026_c0_g1_i1.p1  ORF type:complete len:390 (-),score=76.94 TRINITY_DN59026_c0_g1_i1:370-1539(-)
MHHGSCMPHGASLVEIFSNTERRWFIALVIAEDNGALTVRFEGSDGKPKEKACYREDPRLAPLGTHKATGYMGGAGEHLALPIPPGFEVVASASRPGQVSYLDGFDLQKYASPALAWQAYLERRLLGSQASLPPQEAPQQSSYAEPAVYQPAVEQPWYYAASDVAYGQVADAVAPPSASFPPSPSGPSTPSKGVSSPSKVSSPGNAAGGGVVRVVLKPQAASGGASSALEVEWDPQAAPSSRRGSLYADCRSPQQLQQATSPQDVFRENGVQSSHAAAWQYRHRRPSGGCLFDGSDYSSAAGGDSTTAESYCYAEQACGAEAGGVAVPASWEGSYESQRPSYSIMGAGSAGYSRLAYDGAGAAGDFQRASHGGGAQQSGRSQRYTVGLR